MINIKVIEIRKCFQFVSVLITVMMFVLFFSVLLADIREGAVVKANGMEVGKNMDQIHQDQGIRENIFVLVMNKAIPLMDVMYKTEYRPNHYSGIFKLVLNRLINFDYRDPKTLLGAQIPAFKSAEKDLALQFQEDAVQLNLDDLGEKIEIPEVQQPSQGEGGKDSSGISTDNALEDDQLHSEIPKNTENVQPAESGAAVDPAAERIQIVSSAVRMPNKVKLDLRKPVIFIYHTHATESYLPEEVGNFHSLNRKFTVRRVGDELTTHLTKKGYKVVHDDTVHDYPSYEKSYVRSLETLKANLKKEPTLKIVFDIHRDAVISQEQANNTITINGEKVAKFQLILGGKNENFEQLKIFADYINAKSDELYPGLAKKILIKDYAKFNQYNSDYYALIEIGNISNHIDEAARTTKYLAEIIDAVIQDIKE
ncbi:stage II sporulation protein P [Thermotalea metallivorans]|uniref:Stage II sporulation protein P n=1 Tax=Thermotalea metallivorans TaxID=520762 RepID=A0A140KZ91_9FIRM|nr:stage II sporulation protein P [Thermotalea metallivorans]KXG73616.1 hypothetical protein AN619_30620 [Thermotalea metallivorans]